MEIARYGETKKNTQTHITTNHFSKIAKNGTLYSIIKEIKCYTQEYKPSINIGELGH